MISVVIATRNRAAKLRRTLERVVAEEPDEIVVVDNGSSDETPDVVRAFAVTGLHEPRIGLSRARNTGLRAARGDRILGLDDDCLPDPGWLEAFARGLDEADVVGGRVVLADPADALIGVRDFPGRKEIGSESDVHGYLIGANWAARRTVFDRIGGFDEGLGAGTWARAAEDLDFFYRALRAGFRLEYRPEPLVRHAHGRRVDEVALTSRGYMRGRSAFFGKHLLRCRFSLAKPFYWSLHQTAYPWNSLLAAVLGALRSIGRTCPDVSYSSASTASPSR